MKDVELELSADGVLTHVRMLAEEQLEALEAELKETGELSYAAEKDALEVLFHFGRAGRPPSHFRAALLGTLAVADLGNQKLLAMGFPTFVKTFWVASLLPDGSRRLAQLVYRGVKHACGCPAEYVQTTAGEHLPGCRREKCGCDLAEIRRRGHLPSCIESVVERPRQEQED